MIVTILLLIAIGISFLIQLTFPPFTDMFILSPDKVLSEPWLFVTNTFLHGSITHIFFNGIALFMFGTVLERKISKINFLILYFIAGILGSITYLLTIYLGIIPPIPALGASGAVYGILGATAILVPNMTVYVSGFPMNIRHAAILWFVLEFLGSFNSSSGIASAAHLGGLIFGLGYAFYLQRMGQITNECC